MRRIKLISLFIGLIITGYAYANPPLQFIALGYQQITLSGVQNIPNIPVNSNAMLVCVETANVRWRDDGTPPTSSVGMLISNGQCFMYSGTVLNAIYFIPQSGSPVLDISFYK